MLVTVLSLFSLHGLLITGYISIHVIRDYKLVKANNQKITEEFLGGIIMFGLGLIYTSVMVILTILAINGDLITL